MIYIIDDQVSYNSDDCTLSHIPTQESLSLSISSGRLFEQLLNSGGEILARDTLLTEVWDKYGLRGSNSNLNQYLSIVRRALAAYGCENLIITIPKIGIRLNTDIKIERQSAPVMGVTEVLTDDISEGSITEGSAENVVLPATPPGNQLPATSVNVTRRYWFASVALILLGMVLWYFTVSRPDEQIMPMSAIKLEGGCEAVLLQGLDEVERQALGKQIVQILRENNQTCDAGHRIIFDKNTSFTTKNFGRTILSSCKINSDGHIISCDNFYYLDWRMG